jgi:transposase-like protein
MQMVQQPRQRVTGGFSLDEAARLYRNGVPGGRLVCPTCGGPMREVMGQQVVGRVRLVRCEACGRGLVFDSPAEPDH